MKKIIFFLATSMAIASCQNLMENKKKQTWYKGNTHTHTILCGHADTHPDTVALWYLERDYNFLVLSEHNQFIDPNSVNLPAKRRTDFILIPGEELSDVNHVHTTAMNIKREVYLHSHVEDSLRLENDSQLSSNVNLIQRYVDSTRSAKGEPILNHPNWSQGVPASDIQQVERLNMIELYNGHPDVNNWGSNKFPSMEQKWDSLLTAGKRMYAVSSDDAHIFKTWSPDKSNPGRGWVMVQSEELSPDAIMASMSKGNFYATSGVMLSIVNITKAVYEIKVDIPATYKATNNSFVIGYKNENVKEGFVIEFISDKGKIIQTVEGISAKIEIPAGLKYVRAKVIYSIRRPSFMEQFFAWTQPIFLNK